MRLVIVAIVLLVLASGFIPATMSGSRAAAWAFILLALAGFVQGAIGWRRTNKDQDQRR